MQIVEDGMEFKLHNQQMKIKVVLHEGDIKYRLTSPMPGLDVHEGTIGDICLEGERVQWKEMEAGSITQQSDGSSVGEIRVLADGLVLKQFVQMYPDRPFVRLWACLVNTGSSARHVTDCAIVNIEIAQTPMYLFHVEQFSWIYRSDYFSQHQSRIWPGRTPLELRMGSFPSQYDAPTSCAWFALRPTPFDANPEVHPYLAANTKDEAMIKLLNETDPEMNIHAGPGLVGGIEFNGKSRCYAWASTSSTHIRSHIDNLAHLLAPGETFEVPGVFLGRYLGDWDEAGYATQQYAESYVHPPLPDDRYPWVQYNSWKYNQDINEAQQLEVIDRCHELGIEVVVLDLGWANVIGDWRPNPEKFPRGLAPLAERARSYGMRFGVHLAFNQCSKKAPIAKHHPEWLIHQVDDYFGADALCLGHTPCREWIIDQISELIEKEGIDYIIQDGEDMVKRCTRSDHTHALGDDNYANSQYGLDVVIETLRQKYQHVVFENCEDGGVMMTYKMARQYHTSITVDNIDTYATRQGIYGASYPFSPRYSVRYMQDDPTPYRLRSSIFGGPLILMQRITEWNDDQMVNAKKAIEEYKTYRQLIRSAKVIHLLPPRHNIDNKKGWGWDAIQAVSPDRRESVMMVFRALGEGDTLVIRPRGLDERFDYSVTFKDDGSMLLLNGEQLMNEGISVKLPEEAGEIIHLICRD